LDKNADVETGLSNTDANYRIKKGCYHA